MRGIQNVTGCICTEGPTGAMSGVAAHTKQGKVRGDSLQPVWKKSCLCDAKGAVCSAAPAMAWLVDSQDTWAVPWRA